jgi:hypothetical protein
VLGNKVIAENWDKKQSLEQKYRIRGNLLIYSSYRRLGLVTKPLAIYTSGGVEKVPEKKVEAKDGVKTLRTGVKEAIIQRNEDGTTSIVYPDSDEEDTPIQEPTISGTEVVKGNDFVK